MASSGAHAADPTGVTEVSARPGVALDLRLGQSLNQTMLEAPGGDLGLTGTHRATATRRARTLPVAWAADGERVRLKGADVQLSAFDGKMNARSSLAVGETQDKLGEGTQASVAQAVRGRRGPTAGRAARTDVQASLPVRGKRTLDLAVSHARMKPDMLADAARHATDREAVAIRSTLRGQAWSVGARDELEGNNASGVADRHGVRLHRRRIDGEVQLESLWGKPSEDLASWLPITFQLRAQLEHAATQRAGAGGIDITQAMAGLAKPQRQARQTEAGLVWPSGLRASLRETVLTPLRQGRARPVVFDDLELARSFRSGDWRCSLRGVATSRADGPGYKALQMAGDITFSSRAGLAWRGLADGKAEATGAGTRQRLRLEFGLDVAGLLARGWPGLAPEFLEASSLVRMGGHTDPGHRLTMVEDSQLRLVGGWRF